MMFRAMPALLGVLLVMPLGCARKPSRIELTSPPIELQVESREPILVPQGRVLDDHGAVMAEVPEFEVSPPGIVEVRDGKLIPRNHGDVVLRLHVGDIEHVQTVRFRPPDALVIRCNPRCEGRVGETISLFVDVTSGGEPIFPEGVEVSVADSKVGVLNAEKKLRLLGPGTTTVKATLAGAEVTQVITATNTVDKIALRCPTVYQVVKAADETEMEICYLIRSVPATIRAEAQASGEARPSERLRFEVLDTAVADVFEGGRLLTKKVGQTTLKASLVSDGFVFGQMGLYVDDGDRYGRTVAFSSRTRCTNPSEFTQVAYAWLPEQATPYKLRCLNSTSISCLAAGSGIARSVGRADGRTLRAWAEACCCIAADATQTETGLNGAAVRYTP